MNVNGRTYLHIAVLNNDLIQLKWIINNYPEIIDSLDNDGYSALDYCIQCILGKFEGVYDCNDSIYKTMKYVLIHAGCTFSDEYKKYFKKPSIFQRIRRLLFK